MGAGTTFSINVASRAAIELSTLSPKGRGKRAVYEKNIRYRRCRCRKPLTQIQCALKGVSATQLLEPSLRTDAPIEMHCTRERAVHGPSDTDR